MNGDAAVTVDKAQTSPPEPSGNGDEASSKHINETPPSDNLTSVPRTTSDNVDKDKDKSNGTMKASLEDVEPSTHSNLVATSDDVSKEQGESLPSTSAIDGTIRDASGQAEPLDHPATNGDGPEGAMSAAEEGQEWQQESENEMKRVKVYTLQGSRWLDRGTAFCFGHFSQDGTEALLTARSERSFQDVVLSTTIRSNDVYQRQQDTLIVWTEPDGIDYALSFQEPEGCAEVWNFINEVQRHMNAAEEEQPPGITSSSPILGAENNSATTTNIIRTGHLPAPHLGIISDIETAIKSLARTQAVKERICEYIQQEDYIKQLIDVMHVAEREENLDNLHALFSLIQTILMLNDHSMYEHILEDDLFFGVVGMLEYDPEFPSHKANYRYFLSQTTRYHEPIPFRDPSIQKKIHHTYRLQFLKDVVLARALDDSTFNVLNSCIIFNQIDIISHIQQDNVFLRKVVRLYADEDILSGGGNRRQAQSQEQIAGSASINGDGKSSDDDRKSSSDPDSASGDGSLAAGAGSEEDAFSLRCEVIILVQQLCAMGKNVQLPARMTLFRSLVDRGILFAVQWALGLPEKVESNKTVISAGGEILAALLDHDINGVRGHVLKQVVALEKERSAGKKGADKAETILEMTCRVMAGSKDLAVQSLVGDALKVWLDLPLDTGTGGGASEAHPAKPPTRKDDPGTERFMDYFYKDCVKTLFTPLDLLPEWRNCPAVFHLSREDTNKYVYLCDLLYNFVLQHHFRSHFFVMSSSIMPRIPSLFKTRDKHLQHAAFRFFRLLLKQNNPNMLTQVMKCDAFKPILDLTLRESRRDNLLSCSCHDFFQQMIKDNMKDLIKFIMTTHEEDIKALCNTPLGQTRFHYFIQRYERNKLPPPAADEVRTEKLESRGWPNQRSIEAEEESYFNGDDGDDDIIPSISNQLWSRSGAVTPPLTTGLKRKRRLAVRGAPRNVSVLGSGSQSTPPFSSKSKSSATSSPLVDYDDDEPEADDVIGPRPTDRSSNSPSPMSPRSPLLKVPEEDEDEDDRLLEALVQDVPSSRPQSPAPGMMASNTSLGPMRPGEKRRRSDDDDDDELMARLTRSKKQALDAQKTMGRSIPIRTKPGDDPPPKKFKVKIGAGVVGSVVSASIPPNPAPPESGAKDGDTG